MEEANVSTVDNVILSRRGYCISGTLVLSPYHIVFSFKPDPNQLESPSNLKEIWICYPIIDKINKSRGSSWINNNSVNPSSYINTNHDTTSNTDLPTFEFANESFDHYSASHIRLQCKDFTYYSLDFMNDMICTEVYRKLSELITVSKSNNSIRDLYAFSYKANTLEKKLEHDGWNLYHPITEYKRQGLISRIDDDESNQFWRITHVNENYKFCPSYPNLMIVPSTISDNVLKHAAKFRSKQRIPAIVYKHRVGINGNVIARCAQPLVGLNIQNRSIQDEKLIGEIFDTQNKERTGRLSEDSTFRDQPQKNLIVDLRPITNAMAQHALGAGTENIENYRGLHKQSKDNRDLSSKSNDQHKSNSNKNVDKIFCNIDNIHVMRDSLNKLTTIMNELDKHPISTDASKPPYPLLQQSLTKTQWLHRLSIVLQSVDRITKSIHLNNTNVVIHCSDGWDRTSQVSALLQLCLDPYYRTTEGFMVLIEKEWVSFGFKFATRADHGGCIGALVHKKQKQQQPQSLDQYNKMTQSTEKGIEEFQKGGTGMSSFLQKAARAANHIKSTAQGGTSSPGGSDADGDGKRGSFSSSTYSGSNEKSPIFHQFLDCVYQIYRQHPEQFEFNSRFLKRLYYHYYSCQYGSFLCDSERELKEVHKIQEATVSVWDYFKSRPTEFINNSYRGREPLGTTDHDSVLFFNFTDVKWWYELYGRSDEEMNGLSNSLDRKFAQMRLNHNGSG